MAETIAAVATGNSVSGIGVIHISGDKAIEIAQKVFKSADGTPWRSLKAIPPSTAMFTAARKVLTTP